MTWDFPTLDAWAQKSLRQILTNWQQGGRYILQCTTVRGAAPRERRY